jgi:hypothetical protein
MLNLLRFRERAGRDDGTDCSGEEAYRAHARESAPIFHRLGGIQVRTGRPEPMPNGPPETKGHLAFIAECPSVGAFVSMPRDPDDRKAAHHRQAPSRGVPAHPHEAGRTRRLLRRNPRLNRPFILAENSKGPGAAPPKARPSGSRRGPEAAPPPVAAKGGETQSMRRTRS